MADTKYKIICSIDSRVIASLDMKGTLTIHHDHFTDESGFELKKFIKAIDRFSYCRNIQHLSKRGLNPGAIEEINSIQKEKPGKVYIPPPKET